MMRDEYYFIDYDKKEARITQGPETITVLDNTAALFICRAEGSPAPEIEWLVNNRRVTPRLPRYFSFAISFGKVLRAELVRASEDNNTLIACVAKNAVSSRSVTQTARLYVYPKASVIPAGFPRIVKPPGMQVVEKDQRVTLTCQVNGEPRPRVLWIKDYIPVDLSLPRLSMSPNGDLIIAQALPQDDGKYACIARNVHGSAESADAQLYVRVRTISPHFSSRPSNVEVTPGSSANITCIAVGSPMPVVRWFDSHGVDLDEKSIIGKNVLRLTDIQSDENYTCVADNNLGRIQWMVLVRVLKMPEPPTELRVVRLEARAAIIEFRQSVTPEVRSYTISYREEAATSLGASHNWIQMEGVPNQPDPDAGDRVIRAHIRGLKPFTKYQLKVNSITTNASSVNAKNNTVIEFTTKELAPGSPPQNIRVTMTSRASVIISWEEPRDVYGILKGFYIYYTTDPTAELGAQTRAVIRPEARRHTINNLDFNVTYYVRMSAFNEVGEGPVSDQYPFVTLLGNSGQIAHENALYAAAAHMASQPKGFQCLSMDANTIQVYWDPLLDQDSGRVASYVLSYKSSASYDDTQREEAEISIEAKPETGYMLRNLRPSTSYHMQLTPINVQGSRGMSTDTVVCKTMEFNPDAPEDIKATVVNGQDIVVEWSPPKLQKSAIQQWRVSYYKASDSPSTGKHIDVNNEAANQRRYRYTIRAWSPRLCTLCGWQLLAELTLGPTLLFLRLPGHILMLLPPILLLLLVPPCYVAWQPRPQQPSLLYGPSFANDCSDPDTCTAVPSAPRDLRAIVSSIELGHSTMPVVDLSWKPPDTINSPRIEEYQLTVSVIEPPELAQLIKKEVLFISRDSSGKRLQSELKPGVTYNISLAAKNNEGYGPKTTIMVKTEEAVPLGFPEDFGVTHMSDTSVSVALKPPNPLLRNGVIHTFEIHYWEQNSEHETKRSVNRTSSTESILVQDLNPKGTYLFRCRAYNSAGAGPWSSRLRYAALGFANYQDETGAMLTRKQPNSMRQVPLPDIGSNTFDLTIDGLEPDTTYNITVYARYAFPSSAPIAVPTSVICVTLPRPPKKVEPPVAVSKDASKRVVTLRLSRATDRRGRVDRYYLIVSPESKLIGTNLLHHANLIASANPLVKSSQEPYIAACFTAEKFAQLVGSSGGSGGGGGGAASIEFSLGYGDTTENCPGPDGVGQVAFNKALMEGQAYKAVLRACLSDAHGGGRHEGCTNSEWSLAFGTHVPLATPSRATDDGNNYHTLIVVLVISALGLTAVVCIAVGCIALGCFVCPP
uniref:protein-tyrosine-phosphatase n=1 Tax=Macrostomum lignano TaxID=282301 RepID=A0A1I8J799_9PLAT